LTLRGFSRIARQKISRANLIISTVQKYSTEIKPQTKMKSNHHITSSMARMGFTARHILVFAFWALLTPFIALAQQTVFYDTFGNSTINGGPTTNMIPGSTPTASSASYEIGSSKNATATTNFPGHLQVITASTSSGNTEAQ
jgi:hypothetical protein